MDDRGVSNGRFELSLVDVNGSDKKCYLIMYRDIAVSNLLIDVIRYYVQYHQWHLTSNLINNLVEAALAVQTSVVVQICPLS